MYKWDELEELKENALDSMDTRELSYEDRKIMASYVVIYQNEQILRELKSIGWKLKEIKDNGSL